MKKFLILFFIAIILVPVVLLIFRKDNIITREEAIAYCESPESKYYTWRDLEIHYTEYGDADTTILMVHGFGGSHKNFLGITEILKEDFRVICVDLPAFGLSEVPSPEVADEEMFGLYQAFIRNSIPTLDIGYYHLIGNSLGGWIAWDLATENDSSLLSLTLLNSAGFGIEKVRETATGWMTGPFGEILFKKGVPLRMSQSNAKRCFSDDSKVDEERVKENYYMLNKQGTFPWMLRMATNAILPDTASLAQITCPTLVFWGDEDEIVPVEHAAKFDEFLKNNELIIYERCGHTPQMEYPDLVAEDWLKFVTKTVQ